MSQHNKGKKLEIVTEVHETEESLLEEEPETVPSPLSDIMLELETVATGGSAQKLRQIVQRVFPKTAAEGVEFLKQLNRLKNASEVVVQAGQEQYSFVSAKPQ